MKLSLRYFTLYCFCLLFTSTLSAQVRLQVQGDGQISGDLSTQGRVGIGLAAPKTGLHLNDDQSLLIGSDTSGAGMKLLYWPDLGAFRVGALAEDISSPEIEANYWDRDSVGLYSFASGYNPLASGSASFIGAGDRNTASGANSFVGGGKGLLARSYSEVAFGQYNEDYPPNNIIAFDQDDRLFVIGNGMDEDNRSNALTLLKNGHLGLGTSSLRRYCI